MAGPSASRHPPRRRGDRHAFGAASEEELPHEDAEHRDHEHEDDDLDRFDFHRVNQLGFLIVNAA